MTTADPNSSGELDDQPAVALLVQQLRELVDALLANHGRRLPPERDLAKTLGVGRTVLRRALDVLERDGLVVRHVGRGTYVAGGAGSQSMRLHALVTLGAQAIGEVNGLSARELLEVRYAIEPAIAELAAVAARPDDIEAMRECLSERERACHIDDYEYWDYALHTAIAAATHNAVLSELALLVGRLRQTIYWRQFRRRSIAPDRKARSDREHRAIVDAIACADSAQAFELMRIHVISVSARFNPVLGRAAD